MYFCLLYSDCICFISVLLYVIGLFLIHVELF